MDFKASLDNISKVVSLGIIILFMGFIYLGMSEWNRIGIVSLIMPILLSVTLLTAFCFRPHYYSVEYPNLVIHRNFGDIKIPVLSIKSSAILEREDMGFVLRTFGVGGLFGYFGSFFIALKLEGCSGI